MGKRLLVTVLAGLLWASSAMAMDTAGITMPPFMEAGETSLLLNGAGMRTKWFMRLYVGGLYLRERGHDPKRIISADEPMAIRLHIISSLITSEKMEKATREGFEKATGGDLGPITAQIEQFIAVFREKINENDTYDLIYLPSKGVEVYKNQKRHCLIEGLTFKKALFGIWLCDKPAQKSLKQAMLSP
ncbi:MAG: chalcone isomerase family protein [Thermodesulfobacteriota bacterium]|nr:chalcone isomerase family protein [Thermodesulfobacteriota bacterium]